MTMSENTEKMDLRSINYHDLTDLILEMGEKRFRAEQIYDWLHKKQADSFDEMKNVPAALKERLSEEYAIYPVAINRVQESSLDGTKNYLFNK